MRKNSPVVYHPEHQTWMVFGYDDVRRGLTDYHTFSSQVTESFPEEQIIKTHVQTSDPPRHTKLRGLAQFAFTPKRIAAMEERIRAITNQLIDRVAAAGQMDLMQDLAVPLPIQVIAEILGVPEDQSRFKEWADALFESANLLLFGDFALRPHLVKAFAEMRAYFAAKGQERRVDPREDLITALVQAEVEGEHLSDKELAEFCILLMAAGHETTTNLIGNAMLSLLENPDQMALVQRDPALMPGAVEETLRYRAPVHIMVRKPLTDVEMGGQVIPAGQQVLFNLGSANRDETRFPDPDKFDITRTPQGHMAFGHGIHFCLGAPLARLEARVALTALFGRLEDLTLANGQPLELVPNMVVFGLKALPVRFRARD